MLKESSIQLEWKRVIWCHNLSATALVDDLAVFYRRTKQIEIEVHFVREKDQQGWDDAQICPSCDIITKALPQVTFESRRNKCRKTAELEGWKWISVWWMPQWDQWQHSEFVTSKMKLSGDSNNMDLARSYIMNRQWSCNSTRSWYSR